MGKKPRKKGRRLNDKVVAELPFSSKQYTVWDLSLEGCGVRISARTKACVTCLRTGRKVRFLTVGTITPDTPYEFLREKAMRDIAEAKRQLPPKELAGQPTLSEVIDQYARAHPDMKATTVAGYRERLNLYFKPQMTRPLVLLTTDEILRLNEECIKKLEAKDPVNRPPRGFQNYQSSLRSLRALVSWQAAKARRPNPWPDRRVLRIKPAAARELPIELQCASGRRRLIEGLKAIDSKNARGCRFLCYTGLRRKEGMELAAGNLLSDCVVEFASKTRKVRIPLAKQAAELIDKSSPTTLMKARDRELRRPLNRIFGTYETTRGRRSRVTPHDLRRLFKTVGTELGIDPTVLNLLVGHTVKGVDKHYIAKLRLSVLREAAQKIADEIDNPREVEGEDEILTFSTGYRPEAVSGQPQSELEVSKVTLARAADYLKFDQDSLNALRRYSHYLTRQQMHELVWTVPMWELKDQFGLSDRGLAKICARSGIPVPGRGYWTKVEAGQLLTREPLHTNRAYPRIVRVRGKVPPPTEAKAA